MAIYLLYFYLYLYFRYYPYCFSHIYIFFCFLFWLCFHLFGLHCFFFLFFFPTLWVFYALYLFYYQPSWYCVYFSIFYTLYPCCISPIYFSLSHFPILLTFWTPIILKELFWWMSLSLIGFPPFFFHFTIHISCYYYHPSVSYPSSF